LSSTRRCSSTSMRSTTASAGTPTITTTRTRCHANRDRSGGLGWHQQK
jgi:hypothetical protein